MKFPVGRTVLIVAAVGGLTYFTINGVFRRPFPRRSSEKLDYTETRIYRQLLKGVDSENIEWESLDGTLSHIRNEFDCSDFKLVNLIRILYEYPDSIPSDIYTRIRNTLLDFRFWWDDKGGNSMCYWSENHQILFASAEHLIGEYFSYDYFSKASMSGKELSERGLARINEWLDQKWKYGFSEYYSNVYYIETIAALVNIIDYSTDTDTRRKAEIILDLLLYDLVLQSFDGNFVSTSSRAYEDNRKFSDMGGMDRYFQGDRNFESCRGMLVGLMVSEHYKLPEVLSAITNDTSSCIICQGNGLDISDLPGEGLLGQEERQLMMQWGMEAFVNPELVGNTIQAMRSKRMFRNSFLTDMKWLDFLPFVSHGLLGGIVRSLDPFLTGTALQKGNTYTYRTKYYSIYTSQAYHPGEAADQQHVFGFNMPGGISVFHSHPSLSRDVRRSSPNFWVGYGRLPHSVQDKNINLSIYRMPEKRMFLEKELLDYTYLYYPEDKFDEIVISDNTFFGKCGDAYCAVIAANGFSGQDADLLFQKGDTNAWITEMGDRHSDGNFNAFIERIRKNKYVLNGSCLYYESNGVEYKLTYRGDFEIDGAVTCLEYDGYCSPYMHTKRAAEQRTIVCGHDSLQLDFYRGIRICG